MCRFMIALHLVIWYAVYNVRVSAVLVHLVSTVMYVVFAPVVLNFRLRWLRVLHLPILGGVSMFLTWVHVPVFLSVYVRRIFCSDRWLAEFWRHGSGVVGTV